MILAIVLLIVGLALLTRASDSFVDGAVELATALRVSPIVIGAIVVGFGTSAPEMVVSGIAAGNGDRELGIGNIIGSNVANLSLVLGVAALLTTIAVSVRSLRSELVMSASATVLFAVLVQDGLSRTEGLALVAAFVLALAAILGLSQAPVPEPSEEAHGSGPLIATVLGLIGTVAGAWMAVRGATGIADEFDLTGGFVGFTLVALGTSLPELVTTVQCARRGEGELIVGNLLGSNIFNSLAVGAVVSLIGPGQVTDAKLTVWAVLAMLTIVAFVVLIFLVRGGVSRWAGIVLLAAYVATLPLVIERDDEGADGALPVVSQSP